MKKSVSLKVLYYALFLSAGSILGGCGLLGIGGKKGGDASG
jgi:hypothetical protein